MFTATVVATALSDGSARQCAICPEDIKIGSLAALDAGGRECHPECVGLTPREARQARASAGAPRYPGSGAPEPVGDLGDQVAALMLADRGISRPIRTSDQTGSRFDDSPLNDAQSFLHQCESLGPRNPQTGLRRGQDLQDAVAERLLESRRGVL